MQPDVTKANILLSLQESSGRNGHPVLRIVSFKADMTNRGPTYDIDLCELTKDGRPISYAEARNMFRKDASRKCVFRPTY